ncbi:Uncharacterised protein [Legionella spiritensis]|nr:Uncharacterised protein [Legionella spiritensis]
MDQGLNELGCRKKRKERNGFYAIREWMNE